MIKVVQWAIMTPEIDMGHIWCYSKNKKKTEENAKWFRRVFKNKDFHVVRVTSWVEDKT
jgi:hypothetical protein